MKELTKLALILKSLGITAKVVTDEYIMDSNGDIISDNLYLECGKDKVHFDIWFEGDGYELHFTLGEVLVYDTVFFTDLLQVVHEVTEKILYKEG